MGTENEARIFIASCEHISADLTQQIETKVRNILGDDGSQLKTLVCGTRGDLSMTLRGYFLQLYRKYRLHRNERETVLCPDDQFICTQLSLASINKETVGDFDVDVSDVLHMNRKLLQHRFRELSASPVEENCLSKLSFDEESILKFVSVYDEFLTTNNVTDFMSVCHKIMMNMEQNEELAREIQCGNFLLFGMPSGSVERKMTEILAEAKELHVVKVEIPLEASFSENFASTSLDFLIEKSSVESALCDESEHSSLLQTPQVQPKSLTELYVEKVLVDYVQLMVNSCHELSLSRVLNVPDRQLDHAAFTHLKHEAQAKGVSMYQTALSHVMRVRLGGRSYAPDPKSKLHRYVKGLSEFTDFMHKLQNVLEDESHVQTAVKRILTILKNNVIKGSGFRSESVESVFIRMLAKMQTAADSVHLQEQTSQPVGGSCAQVGHECLCTLRFFLDDWCCSAPLSRLVDVLKDAFSSQRNTPLRLPCLLSKFRSPLEYNSPKGKPPLADRLKKKAEARQNKAFSSGFPRFKANNDWCKEAEFDADAYFEPIPASPECSRAPTEKQCMVIRPAKRISHSTEDQENIPESSQDSSKLSKGTPTKPSQNRLAVSEPAIKKARGKQSKPKKQTTRDGSKAKQTKLLKGQKQLTSFFRV